MCSEFNEKIPRYELRLQLSFPQTSSVIYFGHKATVNTPKRWWEKQVYFGSALRIAHVGNEKAELAPTLQSRCEVGHLSLCWLISLLQHK